MTNDEKGWKIIKDMCISGPWQEHIAHKAVMTAMEWKDQQVCEFLRTNTLLQNYLSNTSIEKLIKQWEEKQ